MLDLQICRICLNNGVRGYKLSEHYLLAHYELIMGQKITPKDTFPQWLCFECAMLIQKFHMFREKCLRGEKILKNIAIRTKISHESVANINRYKENLISPLSIAKLNKLIRTEFIRHNHDDKSKIIIPKPFEIIIPFSKEHIEREKNMENSVFEIDTDEHTFSDENFIKSKMAENDKGDIRLKTSRRLGQYKTHDNVSNRLSKLAHNDNYINKLDNAITDIDKAFCDKVKTNHNNVKSSDDECLNIIAKENSKCKTKKSIADTAKKKKKNTKTEKEVVLKNTQALKHVLNLQFWKKINLSEEEALREFKKREFSNYYLKARFKCQDCFKGFSKNEMLERHLKQRHDESCGNVVCRFCRMRFKLKHHLVKHIKEHLIIYSCLVCKLQCTRLTNAITHQERHAGIKKECKHCGKEFSHLSTYYTHVRMSHRSAHVCVACGASFVSELGLLQHTKLKHFDNLKQLEKEILERREASHKADVNISDQHNEGAGAEIYCAKCDIRFMSRRAYNLHFFKSDNHDDGEVFAVLHKSRTNHRSRPKIPTNCEHCDLEFPSRQAYKKHHQAAHSHIPLYIPDERDICEVCGASIQAKSIQYHMKSHTGEREFTCPAPACGVKFTLKANMQRHYNIKHLGIVYPKYIRKNATPATDKDRYQ